MLRSLTLAALLLACTPLLAQDASKKDDAKDELAAELFKLTNEERAKQKRPALKQNEVLTKVAKQQADELARQNNPQQAADGNATLERLKALIQTARYRYTAMGENIAFGHQSGADVIELWLKNNVHRDNLHSPRYTQVGIASAKAADGTLYFVEIFASPARR